LCRKKTLKIMVTDMHGLGTRRFKIVDNKLPQPELKTYAALTLLTASARKSADASERSRYTTRGAMDTQKTRTHTRPPPPPPTDDCSCVSRSARSMLTKTAHAPHAHGHNVDPSLLYPQQSPIAKYNGAARRRHVRKQDAAPRGPSRRNFAAALERNFLFVAAAVRVARHTRPCDCSQSWRSYVDL